MKRTEDRNARRGRKQARLLVVLVIGSPSWGICVLALIGHTYTSSHLQHSVTIPDVNLCGILWALRMDYTRFET